METLEGIKPIRRRLFRSGGEFSARPGIVVIPCSQRRRRMRWVFVILLLAGLWGLGMAGQLAQEPSTVSKLTPPVQTPAQ